MSVSRISSKDLHISKTLAWLLRHGASKEKLPITEDGFLPLDSVVQHRSLRGQCTVDDIKRIVVNDNKQRYTLRTCNNKLEIKANQGHSLQAVKSLDLKPLTRPEELPTVVHGTFYRAWESIRQNGLSRMNRNHIHFATGLPSDNSVISGMRRTSEIYIFINSTSALSAGIQFYLSPNGVVLSPGNQNGFIETKHFLKVIDARTGKNLTF